MVFEDLSETDKLAWRARICTELAKGGTEGGLAVLEGLMSIVADAYDAGHDAGYSDRGEGEDDAKAT